MHWFWPQTRSKSKGLVTTQNLRWTPLEYIFADETIKAMGVTMLGKIGRGTGLGFANQKHSCGHFPSFSPFLVKIGVWSLPQLWRNSGRRRPIGPLGRPLCSLQLGVPCQWQSDRSGGGSLKERWLWRSEAEERALSSVAAEGPFHGGF